MGEIVEGYNLNVAWGMLNNSYVPPADWNKIGKWAAYMEVWSTFPQNGSSNMYYVPVNFHKCTKEDLNYFYPIARQPDLMEKLF